MSPRPQITLSYAQTLDGQLATRTGSSQWIGGPESLRFAHGLRARHDAILVGIGTVLADDPRLTVRLVDGRSPLRVVLDSRLRVPLGARVLREGAASGTLIACVEGADPERRAALQALGARVVVLPPGPDGGVALEALLDDLYALGVGTLMVEGGARVITALLRARLADRIAVCVAPRILGTGLAAVGDLGIARLAEALLLDEPRVTAYGADLIIEARISYPERQAD